MEGEWEDEWEKGWEDQREKIGNQKVRGSGRWKREVKGQEREMDKKKEEKQKEGSERAGTHDEILPLVRASA